MDHPRGELSIIIRCSDPRVDTFFEEEETRAAMGLASKAEVSDGDKAEEVEAVIANVGGLLPFAAELGRVVRDAGLLAELFAEGRARVVVTAHSACGGYRAAMAPVGEPSVDARPADEPKAETVHRRQVDDVRRAIDRLRQELPGLEAAGYFLELETGAVIPIEA